MDAVAGESRAVLREALLALRTHRRGDGVLHLSGDLPAHLSGPFLRALERVAAELAANDDARGEPVRDGPRLHADALMALVLRVTDGP